MYSAPAWSTDSSVHIRRITPMYSSVIRPRRSSGTPADSYSAGRAPPRPMPATTLPPDRNWAVLNACAVSTGFRRAIASTEVPIVTRFVRAASPPRTVIVSSHGMSEIVRSVTQIDPMPASSAASTAGHRDCGGVAGGTTSPSWTSWAMPWVVTSAPWARSVSATWPGRGCRTYDLRV